MGGGSWDSGAYRSAAKSRAMSGTPDFEYDSRVKSGAASGVHESLDPKKMVNNMRESRDSDEHPESLPIAIIFDVTGSMGGIPRVLQKKLESLMDVVREKAQIPHPQILVGAVGDAYTDQCPFQIGQFESDNRFDEQLRNIILEGNGGGQMKESYALAYRFAAYHTVSDSFEKRGHKGIIFTMGDEAPYASVTASEVERILGVKPEEDETVESLLAKALEKWEVFHLFAVGGSYDRATDIHDRWRTLLNERFVMVSDPNLVCEVIAGLVLSIETSKSVDAVIADIGLSGADAATVKNALVPVVNSRVPAQMASGKMPGGHGSATGTLDKV